MKQFCLFVWKDKTKKDGNPSLWNQAETKSSYSVGMGDTPLTLGTNKLVLCEGGEAQKEFINKSASPWYVNNTLSFPKNIYSHYCILLSFHPDWVGSSKIIIPEENLVRGRIK